MSQLTLEGIQSTMAEQSWWWVPLSMTEWAQICWHFRAPKAERLESEVEWGYQLLDHLPATHF